MLASHRDGKYLEAIEKITGQKLPRREMMDIEVREDVRPRRDDHKGGKGGGRDRGRGGRDGKQRDRRPPGGKFHDQVASMDPVDAAAIVAEAPFVEVPRQEQRPQAAPSPQQERQPRQDAPRPDKPRQEQRPRQENRPENREPRNDKRERGGQRQYNEQAAKPEAVDKSQLPAFLFRPVPVKKPEPQE
jgi:hypothetical protein